MLLKTRGQAFFSGLVILSCLGVGGTPALAAEKTLEVEANSKKETVRTESNKADGSGAIEKVETLDPIAQNLKTRLSAKFSRRNKSRKARGKLKARGALAAFYAERGYRPLWLDERGFNAKAVMVREELANAWTYGLKAADYTAPALADGDTGVTAELGAAELAMTRVVLKYIRHANGHRFDQTKLSRFLDRKAPKLDAAGKLGELAKAEDLAAFLRDQHPSHRQFKALMTALANVENPKQIGEPVRIPRGPVLRKGDKHPQIALLRRRLGVLAAEGVSAKLYDETLHEAVMAFQKQHDLNPEGVVGLKTRFAMNAPKQDRRKQILANMERWRWMPRDFGATHVRVNIPEYRVRVTDNRKIIHTERVVVGKPINKTPVFSDTMESVVFNPYWNVPQSIIWNEMHGRIPSGYEGGVRNGKMWIRQLPGAKNALGRVKFLFPNKHAVYMHDTPSKSLFAKKRRAFSHGCMRVRNPRRLAEVVMGMNGWSKDRVSRKWAAKANAQIGLKKKIPVHVTYFTLWADESGDLKSFGDVYGHDNRIFAAIDKGVAYAKARFPEVRKKKIEPRLALIDERERERRYNDWWEPSHSGGYWGGHSRRRDTRRNRNYRSPRPRARQASSVEDIFSSLF